ncbi:hypothetical protein BGW36DRAFT_306900 [Talaromyces proteolyticus]|uniref:Uncharacterized protein n=1 Tax=Talaromyces proteolyticus TaxID=1131652 RepID=A0AAD4KES7_9EURO|nr:uncharacterized protein BGW36DRAFT_306900 [Talaromyces proteolyticus]KAH8690243.1 hypothetical protein BGW36DRAFT_306900 [Talaromyces proteolyticus]
MTNTNGNQIPHGTWRQLNAGCWTRECVGGEQAVSYNQNVRDGHTELTIEVLFSTSLSTWELIRRVRNAWLVSHSMHPEIAIQLSTGTELPQMMQFEQLQSDADAAEWLKETLRIVTDQSTREVTTTTYSRRLPTKGKRNMLYLVTAPAADCENPTRHSLVWNVSHIFADAFSIVQFVNHFLQTVTQVDDDYLTVDHLDYAGVLGRLPVTPVTVYEEKYKPTKEQRQQALDEAIRQGELYASKMPQSIAMYPETDVTSRVHATHCIRLKYTLAESEALLAQLRDDNLSITYAAAAATLLAVKQTYTRGHETGALLGMTRNARRWIDTLGHHGKGGPVPSAADVVFLWIPFETHWFQGSTRNTVLFLGRAIRTELGPHLVSPHYLASLSFTSDRVVANLASEKEPIAAPCAPGFSSQGALALKREFCSDTASIKIQEFSHTGRQINVSPWVGMFSLWNQITLSLGFDSKYYDPIAMDSFMALVQSNLRSVISPPGSSKL